MDDSDFVDVIKRCKKNDQQAILFLIGQFDPILRKYSRLLYQDDAKQELILSLLETIMQIPLSKIKNDSQVVSYISKSIRYKYIYLSKRKMEKNHSECELNEDIAHNAISQHEDQDWDTNIVLKESINSLSKKQQNIVILRYIYGFKDIEIAMILHISRQAVSKARVKALEKLRAILQVK